MCLKDHLCHTSAAVGHSHVLFPFGVQVCTVQEDAEKCIERFGGWPGKCLHAVPSQNSCVVSENFLLFLRKFEVNSSGCERSPTAAVVRTGGSSARQEQSG